MPKWDILQQLLRTKLWTLKRETIWSKCLARKRLFHQIFLSDNSRQKSDLFDRNVHNCFNFVVPLQRFVLMPFKKTRRIFRPVQHLGLEIELREKLEAMCFWDDLAWEIELCKNDRDQSSPKFQQQHSLTPIVKK